MSTCGNMKNLEKFSTNSTSYKTIGIFPGNWNIVANGCLMRSVFEVEALVRITTCGCGCGGSRVK
jgi:hypothetical protein